MLDYLSRDDVATYLRCSVRKIDRLKACGRLPYLKLDGNTLFRREHVEALISPVMSGNATPVKQWTPTRQMRDSDELPTSLTRAPTRRAEAA
jgi:excisionase family DNA binding protein